MNPRLNKLILLLLLLGMFVFIVETEQKAFNYLKTELSEWAFFDKIKVDTAKHSINPYSNHISLPSKVKSLLISDNRDKSSAQKSS